MPRLSSLWRKKKRKKERELSISQRKRYKTLFKQWYATVDSAFGAHAINQCTGPGQYVHAHAEQCHIHANRPGRYAARCRSRIPPCPNVTGIKRKNLKINNLVKRLEHIKLIWEGGLDHQIHTLRLPRMIRIQKPHVLPWPRGETKPKSSERTFFYETLPKRTNERTFYESMVLQGMNE